MCIIRCWCLIAEKVFLKHFLYRGGKTSFFIVFMIKSWPICSIVNMQVVKCDICTPCRRLYLPLGSEWQSLCCSRCVSWLSERGAPSYQTNINPIILIITSKWDHILYKLTWHLQLKMTFQEEICDMYLSFTLWKWIYLHAQPQPVISTIISCLLTMVTSFYGCLFLNEVTQINLLY